jgi:hypothetical protein
LLDEEDIKKIKLKLQIVDRFYSLSRVIEKHAYYNELMQNARE